MSDLWKMAESVGNTLLSPDAPTNKELEFIHRALEQAFDLGKDAAFRTIKQSTELHLSSLLSKKPPAS